MLLTLDNRSGAAQIPAMDGLLSFNTTTGTTTTNTVARGT